MDMTDTSVDRDFLEIQQQMQDSVDQTQRSLQTLEAKVDDLNTSIVSISQNRLHDLPLVQERLERIENLLGKMTAVRPSAHHRDSLANAESNCTALVRIYRCFKRASFNLPKKTQPKLP